MGLPRSLCSVVLVFWITSVAGYVVAQRTEQFVAEVTTAISADGHTIAIGRTGGGKRSARVELWDAASGPLQRSITGFDGQSGPCCFRKTAAR